MPNRLAGISAQRESRLQRSKWRPSLSDTSQRIELLAFCQMYGGCNGKLLHRYRGLGMADIWSRKLEACPPLTEVSPLRLTSVYEASVATGKELHPHANTTLSQALPCGKV